MIIRKQLNPAIFAGIFFDPERGQIRAELNEPFASITLDGLDQLLGVLTDLGDLYARC